MRSMIIRARASAMQCPVRTHHKKNKRNMVLGTRQNRKGRSSSKSLSLSATRKTASEQMGKRRAPIAALRDEASPHGLSMTGVRQNPAKEDEETEKSELARQICTRHPKAVRRRAWPKSNLRSPPVPQAAIGNPPQCGFRSSPISRCKQIHEGPSQPHDLAAGLD